MRKAQAESAKRGQAQRVVELTSSCRPLEAVRDALGRDLESGETANVSKFVELHGEDNPRFEVRETDGVRWLALLWTDVDGADHASPITPKVLMDKVMPVLFGGETILMPDGGNRTDWVPWAERSPERKAQYVELFAPTAGSVRSSSDAHNPVAGVKLPAPRPAVRTEHGHGDRRGERSKSSSSDDPDPDPDPDDPQSRRLCEIRPVVPPWRRDPTRPSREQDGSNQRMPASGGSRNAWKAKAEPTADTAVAPRANQQSRFSADAGAAMNAGATWGRSLRRHCAAKVLIVRAVWSG